MSHPPPAATAEPTAPPACATPAPSLTTKPRGNPDLHLAPRCGARTRAGCPCRAPAIRGKLRCRMHGGRSTGPRTPKGMASLRAARTIHGAYSAATRARIRHDLTELRRGQVGEAAARCADDQGSAIPAAPPATHGAPMHPPAKAHAPERGAPERGPAPSEAIPPTLPNRAARRRWKSLQRRMHAAPAARSHP